jgi:hypothetical protein
VKTSRRYLDAFVAAAFLPLHKLAFGVATGVAAAILVFLATAVYILRNPQPGFQLELLAQYFAGYSVTWPGALVGAAWAAFSGFVFGWFFAFSRNLLLATMLFIVRRRAELIEARNFLDHL